MDMWTFLACPAPGGGRPVTRFIQSLGPQAENDLNAILDGLRVSDRKFWTRPHFAWLVGKKYKGLGEVRFDGEDKTYRLFGFEGPLPLQFTLMLGYEKKRDLKHEMDEAVKRRKFARENTDVLYTFTFEEVSPQETD
jgi:hypothetical protein